MCFYPFRYYIQHMGSPSFFQYGNKLIRNPAQRLVSNQSVPGLARQAVRTVAPQIERRAVGMAAPEVLAARAIGTRILPVLEGLNLANKFLQATTGGSWANPRKAY